MDVRMQKIQKQEYPLLDNFLYEAIFIPDGGESPPKTIMHLPNCRFMLSIPGNQKLILA